MNINLLPDEETTTRTTATTKTNGTKENQSNAVVFYSFRFVSPELNRMKHINLTQIPISFPLQINTTTHRTHRTRHGWTIGESHSLCFPFHFHIILAKQSGAERARVNLPPSTIHIHILYPNIKSPRSAGDHYLSTSTAAFFSFLFYPTMRASEFLGAKKSLLIVVKRNWMVTMTTMRRRRWSKKKKKKKTKR